MKLDWFGCTELVLVMLVSIWFGRSVFDKDIFFWSKFPLSVLISVFTFTSCYMYVYIYIYMIIMWIMIFTAKSELFCYLSCIIVQVCSYQNKNTITTPVGGIVRLGTPFVYSLCLEWVKWFYSNMTINLV